MRILILHFLSNQSKNSFIKTLSDSASRSGHQVDVVDGTSATDTLRFATYGYIVVVSSSFGLFKGRIHPRVTEVLSSCGSLTGKKGAAFVTKSLFSAPSASRVLMEAMEREGMVVNDFNVLENLEQVQSVGSILG